MPTEILPRHAADMTNVLRSRPDLETVFLQHEGSAPICVHRHRPADTPVAGLLICRPMIADLDANEPREARVARGCVAGSVAVNRFFHRGTGDSYGDFAAATFSDLVIDAELALADLSRDVGDAPIAVLGSRLGSLVAATVATRHDLDLVLWDPVTVPARHTKELLRTQMVHLMKVRESGYTASSLRAALEAGEMIDLFGWDFPGSVFGSLTREIEDAIPDAGGEGRRALLLTTQDHGPDLSPLVPAGVSVERHEIANRDPMWLADFDLASAEASLALIDRTVEWATTELPASGRVVELALDQPVDADFGGGSRESTGFLDAGDEHLAAHLTQPAGEGNGQGLVIMPGAGHGTAAGPNRLWTRLARELAGHGFTVLRFSWRGVANSTGGWPVFDLADPLTADAEAAIEAMRATGVDEISLMGWCYGGVTAAAVADARTRRLILLSPSSRSNTMGIRSHTDQRAESMGLGHMARSFLEPSKWRSLADASERRTYSRMIRVKARQLWRGEKPADTDGGGPVWLNHRWLDDLERVTDATDADVRIMFGRDDTDHRDYQSIRGGRIGDIFARLAPRLEIHRSNGSVHQLHTPAAQQAALVTVRTWMGGLEIDSTSEGTGSAPNLTSGDGAGDGSSLADIEAIVTRVLHEQLGLTPDETRIESGSSLLDEVGLDSVALIRFAMGLEQEFNIEIHDDDLIIDNFGTPRRVAAYIQGRLEP